MDRTAKLKPLAAKLLLLLVTLFLVSQVEAAASSTGEFWPVQETEYRVLDGAGEQKLSAPFQMCLTCKCCASGGAVDCASMPCCFGIDCQLPNKPYGVCAFVPKFCNCTACAA